MSNRTNIKIKRAYFLWLCDKVNAMSEEKLKAGGYFFLMRTLYKKEFYWTVDMDENRAEDGKSLRKSFDDNSQEVLNGPCNMLELLVGLACKWNDEIQTDNDPDLSATYFWMMIGNLGLSDYVDTNFDEEKVREKLDIFLDREYSKDGVGGLFPVKNAKKDFREVELWYQLQEYLIENYDF